MEQRRLLCATLTLVVVGLLGCVGGNHAARRANVLIAIEISAYKVM